MDLSGALALFLMFGLIFAVIFGGRTHAWSSRRARTEVRSISGPNVTSLLLAVGIAAFLFNLAGSSFVVGRPQAIIPLVALGVVLIIGTVVAGSLTRAVVAVLGLGLVIATLGPEGAVKLGGVLVFVWLTLAVVRGFVS